MGYVENGWLRKAFSQTRQTLPPQPEEVFSGREIIIPQNEGRNVYEQSGTKPQTEQYRRYQENLRELQNEYVAAGLHMSKEELTKRQRSIIALTAQGLSDFEIAESLSISMSTVSTHSVDANERLETKNKLHRVLTATVLGDIDLLTAVDEDVLRRIGYQDLSPQTWRVMQALIANFGANNSGREIASAFTISESTASSHISNLMNKLGINTKVQIGTNAFVSSVSTGEYTLDAPTQVVKRQGIVFEATASRQIGE